MSNATMFGRPIAVGLVPGNTARRGHRLEVGRGRVTDRLKGAGGNAGSKPIWKVNAFKLHSLRWGFFAIG
jgi:hypothetical protein